MIEPFTFWRNGDKHYQVIDVDPFGTFSEDKKPNITLVNLADCHPAQRPTKSNRFDMATFEGMIKAGKMEAISPLNLFQA